MGVSQTSVTGGTSCGRRWGPPGQLSEKKPGLLDELVAERKQLLEKESAELEMQAGKLADEIRELSGNAAERIV